MTTAYDAWLGRTETTRDVLVLGPARAMQATLDDSGTPLEEGDALPPMWHWLYFHKAARQSEIGPDGHPARGGFMPPVELPRRMFAGAHLSFPGALRLGRPVERIARIASIAEKAGGSGRLVFVGVVNEFKQDGVVQLVEQMDIVYRAAGGTTPAPVGAAMPAAAAGAWTRMVAPDPVLLFRYSALTFNGHRIHYDREYARDSEGYPGLVVHGPLTATFMAELLRVHSKRAVASFGFRARGPLFDLAPFRVDALATDARVVLAAIGPDGRTAMTGEAVLA